MTKKEALQKIKELQNFVTKLDEREKELHHGDIVVSCAYDNSKRIIVEAKDIKIDHLDFRYLLFNKKGYLVNYFKKASDTIQYIKIGNVFED